MRGVVLRRGLILSSRVGAGDCAGIGIGIGVAGGVSGGFFTRFFTRRRFPSPDIVHPSTSTPAIATPTARFHHHRLAHSAFKMASAQTVEQPEWPALRVRNAFLDFFKENGHTFGKWGGFPPRPAFFSGSGFLNIFG